MSPHVWLRFEKPMKDGTVMKLRIEDLPSERIEDAAEYMVKYFVRDEPIRRALGFAKKAETLEEYRVYINKTFRSSTNVMCCLDAEDDHPVIMGISSMVVASASYWELAADKGTPEAIKISNLYYDCAQACDVLKMFNLTSYYSDRSMLVLPEFRGYGIAEKFLTVRRIMCAAHGISLTAGWMTNIATQIAAERDGWETVHEIPYDFFTQKYGVTFDNAPTTLKCMVAKPHPDYQAVMEA